MFLFDVVGIAFCDIDPPGVHLGYIRHEEEYVYWLPDDILIVMCNYCKDRFSVARWIFDGVNDGSLKYKCPGSGKSHCGSKVMKCLSSYPPKR